MDLKTNFVRNQENAQDDLNANFLEISQSASTVTLSHSGTDWIDSSVRNNFDLANYFFMRFGKFVYFNCRISNKAAQTSIADIVTGDKIPAGFTPSMQNDTWSGALSVTQQNSSTFVMKASVAPDRIRFLSQGTGNHYVSGTWCTDDPMPEN